MSAYLQPGSVLDHARETTSIDPEEAELIIIGTCESCGRDVADGYEVVTQLRLYHERCAAQIWPEMEDTGDAQ